MYSLIQKYNVPGPRYTSYPTVPFWNNEHFGTIDWLDTLYKNHSFFASNGISLYVHLPFCESLCTFCGCHKRITKNHSLEEPYIDSLIKEWQLYLNQLPFHPIVRELHFGGGTPTFFRIGELLRLLEGIFQTSHINPSSCLLSFEAHPNNTTEEHLQGLYDFGFRRISFGVQDYNPIVQQAIHRIQPFSRVKNVHEQARKIGYHSINHDLVFGLPKQTLSDIENTIQKTLELMPDRIALYSYAHVPWIKGNGQRGFSEEDIPKNDEKRILYETAKTRLVQAGYIEIGMDHFALPDDELAKAFNAKKLHRNFMGYTTQSTSLLIGLGMSAISDSWFGFAQNEKNLEEYQLRVNKGEIPIVKGHQLSTNDLENRKHILDLMCHFKTTFGSNPQQRERYMKIKNSLQELVSDQLVKISENTVEILPKGVPFVRNVCMAFDEYLPENSEKMFSQTV